MKTLLDTAKSLLDTAAIHEIRMTQLIDHLLTDMGSARGRVVPDAIRVSDGVPRPTPRRRR